VVGGAEAPVLVADTDRLQAAEAVAVGLVVDRGAALGLEAVLVARGVEGVDVEEREARPEADGVRPLEDDDLADRAGVEFADGGIEVEAGREEVSAVAPGGELADAVAADARVVLDRVALLRFNALRRRGAGEQ